MSMVRWRTGSEGVQVYVQYRLSQWQDKAVR